LINKPDHIDDVSHEVEKAVLTGNGFGVRGAVKAIDDTFLLIPKSKLPSITFGTLDEAFAGEQRARTPNLTEKVFDGDHKKMRTLGLQYLVMADYVEAKVVKEQIDSAKLRRFKVFRELFPDHIGTLDQFSWDSLHKFEQTVIDKMVLMHIELDKNF
jgi:hypothetical protein